jgi:ABC-2 type transport system permease protein
MLIGYTAKDTSKISTRASFIVYPSFLATGVQITPLIFPMFFQIAAYPLPMNWLNRLIRGMALRGQDLSAFGLEIGALLMIIGVSTLFIGLLFTREGRKMVEQYNHQSVNSVSI